MTDWKPIPPTENQLAELFRLREELETERLRLAACGVVAMSNTKESRVQARTMKPEYWSASCEDVAKAVDREIDLREERDRLRAALETVEWIDDYEESTGKFVFCPCCNREKKHGHYECRLEEALKETL